MFSFGMCSIWWFSERNSGFSICMFIYSSVVSVKFLGLAETMLKLLKKNGRFSSFSQKIPAECINLLDTSICTCWLVFNRKVAGWFPNHPKSTNYSSYFILTQSIPETMQKIHHLQSFFVSFSIIFHQSSAGATRASWSMTWTSMAWMPWTTSTRTTAPQKWGISPWKRWVST